MFQRRLASNKQSNILPLSSRCRERPRFVGRHLWFIWSQRRTALPCLYEHNENKMAARPARLRCRTTRMSTVDKQIADILAKYGEPIAGNIWRVQGQAVIYHKALERIAAQAGIAFDPPTIVRAERDEAVILVTGRIKASEAGQMGDRAEWSIGEALINVNYRVSGRQAAYVYAMAEKRAKDRVILKLIGLHGLLYSEEEADEFKSGAVSAEEPEDATQGEATLPGVEASAKPRSGKKGKGSQGGADAIKRKIDKAGSIKAVTDLMLGPETQ